MCFHWKDVNARDRILPFYVVALSILSISNRIPTSGQWQKGSHVYVLLIVTVVLLL